MSVEIVQGFLEPHQLANTSIRSAFVAPSQLTPLWGGMAVTASLPGGPASLGAYLSLATSASNLTGFSVFNESSALLKDWPDSVPVARAGNGEFAGRAINWVPMRSGAKLWVQCSKDAANALSGGSMKPTVYWDWTRQMLLCSPVVPGDLPIGITLLRIVEQAAQVVDCGGNWDHGHAALIQI